LVGNIMIPEPIILTMVRMVSCTTPILLLLALIIYTPTSAVKKSDSFANDTKPKSRQALEKELKQLLMQGFWI